MSLSRDPRPDLGETGLLLRRLVEEVLVIERRGADEFVSGHSIAGFDRLYGGQIAAQALRAAGHTVAEDLRVHSVHVSYLRLGDPTAELTLVVERVRDTRRAATRLVRTTQAGGLIALVTASFQRDTAGVEHGRTPAPARIPAPDTLPTRPESLRATFGEAVPENARTPWPIDVRHVDRAPWSVGATPEPRNRMWLRVPDRVGDDSLLHACLLTYASDLTMFEPVLYPHEDGPDPLLWERLTRGEIRGGSLDHTIWFHRPFRIDDWLLHEHASPVAAEGRGLSLGHYFTAEGTLVASVAQEVAILHTPRRPVLSEVSVTAQPEELT
ncbi:acyl-CoA thioesterase [Streptosporangium sp. CA-115845]|uniref:acyl-CoA thioesterase n=1 Tax=Streptosporangium sp. CA-115845 TaxID=3240071 RepID=UPI003D941D48